MILFLGIVIVIQSLAITFITMRYRKLIREYEELKEWRSYKDL